MRITEIFLKSVLANLPRLLGQLNRNPLSSSYGSFDRAYWHYRTNDISCSRYQEAALTLALLYANNFDGNIYFGNKRVLAWLNASLEFTLLNQNKDGSFNEWYLNERSYVATAFVSAAIAEILAILGRDFVNEYDKLLTGLTRAADWLKKHTEELVYNQLAGSVLALAKIGRLTGNGGYSLAAKEKLAIIEKNQSPEGWWSEYGGPDIGYLSLMIDYLTKYYLLENSENVLSMLKKANAFLVNFLQPNLTAGGEHMSRNTEYLIPSGFAYLSGLDDNAKIITDFNLTALAAETGLGPSSLDDRYLCYILYNWLQAGIFLSQNGYDPAINIKDYLAGRRLDIFYKQSGLSIKQNDKYYLVVNLYKGGAFRLGAGEKAYLDSGIEIKLAGRGMITNSLDYSNKIVSQADFMEVNGGLKPVKESLMKTPIMILFKLFQLSFGRLGRLQLLLKKLLRKKMIMYKKSAGISFKRQFVLGADKIIITDEIGAPVLEKDFILGLKTSYNFIPSSKYFTLQEINDFSRQVKKEYYSEGNKSSCRRTFYFN